MKDSYINIKKIAEAKGLRSTRSIRLELNKVEGTDRANKIYKELLIANYPIKANVSRGRKR